jgi:hypothetical protein
MRRGQRGRPLLVNQSISAILSLSLILLMPSRVGLQEHIQDGRALRTRLRTRLQTSKALKPQLAETNDRFRDSLLSDELNDQNPYAGASGPEEILGRLVVKGVRDFKRIAYRSPRYKGEFGYDVVHYAVEQMDGSQSSVLAYLENRETVVMVVIVDSEKSELNLFRSGAQVEKSSVSSAQASALIERTVSESVPFLSASR